MQWLHAILNYMKKWCLTHQWCVCLFAVWVLPCHERHYELVCNKTCKILILNSNLPACSMSLVVMPLCATARVECALNMEVSIPANSSTILSHLAIVADDTGLWGLKNEQLRFVRSFPKSFRHSQVSVQGSNWAEKLIFLVLREENVMANWLPLFA